MTAVGDEEAKLVYIKRWRTIVKLPRKYADEIVSALRSSASAAAPKVRTSHHLNKEETARLQGGKATMNDQRDPDATRALRMEQFDEEHPTSDEACRIKTEDGVILQARSKGGEWVNIFPAQVEQFSKYGCELRAVELAVPSHMIASASMILTDRELYDNGCITRYQLTNWKTNDYTNHISGLEHTIKFLLARLDAVSEVPDGRGLDLPVGSSKRRESGALNSPVEHIAHKQGSASVAWPPLKKALWDVLMTENLNDGHYIKAFDLIEKLYAAALASEEKK